MDYLVTLLFIVGLVSSAPRNLEAEWFRDFIGNRQAPEERVIPRGNAKNNRNIWLKRDETLTMKFCQYAVGFVSVRNILWSNDGWSDTVVVKIDSTEIGNFTTNDDSNWGHLWNTMYESGPVGSRMRLEPGEHFLTLEVLQGDRYGVEFDRIVLELEGERHADNLVCPGETRENRSQIAVKDNVMMLTFTSTPDEHGGKDVEDLNRGDSGGSVGNGGHDGSTGGAQGSNGGPGNDGENQKIDVGRIQQGNMGQSSGARTTTYRSGDIKRDRSKAERECGNSKENDFWNLASAFLEWIKSLA